jgi:ankyrin repeat protein
VNAADNDGETAIMKAARCGHMETVKAQGSLGADVKAMRCAIGNL